MLLWCSDGRAIDVRTDRHSTDLSTSAGPEGLIKLSPAFRVSCHAAVLICVPLPANEWAHRVWCLADTAG